MQLQSGSVAQRSATMRAIRSHGNLSTELRLIGIFRAHGIKGWRRKAKLRGKPDFVFSKERLAVFVDGCFWHGCRVHCRIPRANRKYWLMKIAATRARDLRSSNFLRANGWRVIRIWEHELVTPDRALSRLQRNLSRLLPSDGFLSITKR